jgi:hypothetical protein
LRIEGVRPEQSSEIAIAQYSVQPSRKTNSMYQIRPTGSEFTGVRPSTVDDANCLTVRVTDIGAQRLNL